MSPGVNTYVVGDNCDIVGDVLPQTAIILQQHRTNTEIMGKIMSDVDRLMPLYGAWVPLMFLYSKVSQ